MISKGFLSLCKKLIMSAEWSSLALLNVNNLLENCFRKLKQREFYVLGV